LLATILCLGLFAYFTVVGYALLSLLSDEEPLYLLLLSPTIGATALVIPTFLVNELGVPIKYFAHVLVILILAAALIVLWLRGRRIPSRQFWPYALLICLAMMATGWPMLRFGFDWLSFCNDDMANYCMGAARILHYGYYQIPDSRALAGQDYTQFLWFLHILHRPGSEMVLATVAGLTRLSPLQIFMPVILCFMMCQISAAGAMAYSAIRSRTAVWLAMALVGVSALVALGSLYQLIAQVIGLAVLAALVAVLMRPIEEWTTGSRLRHGILIGLLTTGLIIFYQELIPFIVVGYGLYSVLNFRSWLAQPRVGLAVLGIAVAVMVVLLNRFLAFSVVYVVKQALIVEDPLTTVFPYYMIPSGPAYFWGMYPMGQAFLDEKWVSFLVVASILLSAIVGLVLLRSALRRQAPAVMSMVMLAVFVVLFRRHAGFGMYKLAMYFQPFILTAVVVGWMSLWRRRMVQILPLVGLGLLSAHTHLSYVRTSLGEGRGAFSEIPAASSTHLVREYAELLAAHPGAPLELDTYNPVLAKFQMLESRGRVTSFPSTDFLPNIMELRAPAALMGPETTQRVSTLLYQYISLYPRRAFNLHPDANGTPASDAFLLDELGQNAGSPAHPLLIVGQTGRQQPFNRLHDPEADGGNFRCGPPDAFRDHLIFISSELGDAAFFGRPKVAIYQLETDLYFPDRTMAGAGRYILFQVVNPSKQVRVEVSMTDSLASDRVNRLPPAAAIGAKRSPLPMLGRGSARVFSGPLTPQIIDGRPFVGIDMGTAGTYFDYEPRGLMRLWGRQVRLDPRRMVGFVRDISLVSEDDYHALKSPTAIRYFPQDLTDPNLEYSGIYEDDGWVGDRAFVILSQPDVPAKVVCRLVVPRIDTENFSTDVTLLVDGTEMARKTTGPGNVELSADLPANAGHRRIELSFSKFQHFRDPDGRPVGAKLQSIEIESAAPQTAPTH
jgi:hypothetical protein